MLQVHGIKTKILCRKPQIALLSNVIRPEEAEHIIQLAKPSLKPALVASGDGSPERSHTRTNQNCWIQHEEDQVITSITARIARLLSLPLNHAEMLHVVNYQEKEKFDPHFDALTNNTDQPLYELDSAGQRLVTALIYLNTVAQGGQTTFPHLNLKIKPKAGYMLVFENWQQQNQCPDPLSFHGALPVEKNEKWACNLWFREKPWPQESVKLATCNAKRTD